MRLSHAADTPSWAFMSKAWKESNTIWPPLDLSGLTPVRALCSLKTNQFFRILPRKKSPLWKSSVKIWSPSQFFLQDPLIKGVIEALVVKIMEKILPRFEGIFSRAKKESDIQYPMTISQAFFFTAMQVQITAIATLTKPSDHEVALKLFPIAFDRGIAWLLQNGRKGRYLTYRIISGNIDPFPQVSDVPAPFYSS